ncbi:hypothetical protein G6F62_013912 [Rhizopus arrhizus]|nr:hypothetical protein G6F62_013912 [Rhizopus arrhizus]
MLAAKRDRQRGSLRQHGLAGIAQGKCAQAAAVAAAQRVGGSRRGMAVGAAESAALCGPLDAGASSGRKAAATRSFIERAPSATFCPAACAPVLATLPTPAAAPLKPPPADAEPA